MTQIDNIRLFQYYESRRKIYINSKLKDVYWDHISKLFQDGSIPSMLWYNLKPTSNAINQETTFRCVGFYPCHLQYDKDTLSLTNRLLVNCRTSTALDKKMIKKELLRRLFLLTFDLFLSKKKYGIDFQAYYRTPLNMVQFTTEYQNSGRLYRIFFEKSRSEVK